MLPRLLLMLLGLLVAGGVFLGVVRWQGEPSPTTLPSPRAYVVETPTVAAVAPPAAPSRALPEEVNLAIPFTSQAPHRNWDLPYKEFCEEASVLMTAAYLRRESFPNADTADRRLKDIQAFEQRRFGYFEDTTAEETAVILREHLGVARVEVVADPTVADIKWALADGKAVIVPAAGRELPNPYFRQPGPLYHMLVIKGYTKDGRLITNDPGTRRGADFLYQPEVLLRAVHDWNGGDVLRGRTVMLVVG